ncbi:MAG: ribonuclease HI [Candidatus Paceibacterota bacterium]|jgi:ribonuclease HI
MNTEKNQIYIFTDGSSLGNPGPGGWGTIIYNTNTEKVFELGGYEKETTNNRMELIAAIEALLAIDPIGKTYGVTIFIDSAYVLNGITKWVYGWEKNGWITSTKDDVLNRDLWERLLLLVRVQKEKITWQKIKGHSGIPGNERVDQIATSYAEKLPVELFHGSLVEYENDLGSPILKGTDGTLNGKAVGQAQKSKTKTGTGYSYVSLVNGKISIDKTWADCEKRVKGAKGAKYKKTMNKEEESDLIALWSLQSL